MLDAIDWSTLEHALGTAEDVPDLLRALVSDDEDAREEAISELFTTVCHQGSVYSASVAVLPLLLDHLESGSVPDTTHVALLAAAIAGGSGYYQRHSPRDEATADAILRKQGRTLADALREERRVVDGIRQIAEPRLHVLTRYLGHAEPELRLTVVDALACYPSRASELQPLLEAALGHESEEEVVEAMQDAIRALAST